MRKLILTLVITITCYVSSSAQKYNGMWGADITIDGHKYVLGINITNDEITSVCMSKPDNQTFCDVVLPNNVAKIKRGKLNIVYKEFNGSFIGKLTPNGDIKGIMRSDGKKIDIEWFSLSMPPSPN